MAKVPPFSELIAATTRSAVHLETRDAYTPDDERFLGWLVGKPLPVPANPAWSTLVREHAARGIRFRRARVVSEPLADYIRICTVYEVCAGRRRPPAASGWEDQRWTPARIRLREAVRGLRPRARAVRHWRIYPAMKRLRQ